MKNYVTSYEYNVRICNKGVFKNFCTKGPKPRFFFFLGNTKTDMETAGRFIWQSGIKAQGANIFFFSFLVPLYSIDLFPFFVANPKIKINLCSNIIFIKLYFSFQ